jgi:hypothetical protein
LKIEDDRHNLAASEGALIQIKKIAATKHWLGIPAMYLERNIVVGGCLMYFLLSPLLETRGGISVRGR